MMESGAGRVNDGPRVLLSRPVAPGGEHDAPKHKNGARSVRREGRLMAELLRNVHSSLALDVASRIVDEAIAARRREGLLPLAVAVLDAGGNLVAFKREDGCGVLRFDIAFGKAWAALGMGMSTRLIRDRLKDRPAFQGALAAASDGRFVPVPAGVLILDAGGAAIGAVGISGDASDRDEYCAIAAIHAVGHASEPATPAPDWKSAGL